MIKIEYYAKNGELLDQVIGEIVNNFPCFVNREYVEMNYSNITIICRKEDSIAIRGKLDILPILDDLFNENA